MTIPLSASINEAANVHYLQARRELGDVTGGDFTAAQLEQRLMDWYKNGFADGCKWALLDSDLERKDG